ncbi:MAG: DUF2167 domain-containing protein [Gammaproteobacteria bacterium]|nr:DUF2167 domain-containing protein [Gammaproteobacteria bacterium]
MKNSGLIFSLLTILICQPIMAEETQPTPVEAQFTLEEAQYLAEIKKIWNSLDRKQGEVVLPNNVATLNVPENFYYLNPKDSETILVDAWGNPPGAAAELLGMLLPVEPSPFEADGWAVTIEYIDDGYVSDEDAGDINYDDLLEQMQDETRASSKERVQQGYEEIELVGWAARPFYDQNSHKLYWAKELKFGDSPVNTLNYSIRVLGRKGVLVLNFIADINQKAVIDSKMDTVLALANFNQGMRYEDFNPDMDKVAAYGIGALVAGKVLAKTGLIAAALIFLKKFGIVIVIGIAALAGRFFKRKAA